MGRKRTSRQLPTFDEFMQPAVQALKDLGGSGTIEEINNRVFELTKLPDVVLQIPHGDDQAGSEVEYRMAWTRTYLKKAGVLVNSERGVWALTSPAIDVKSVNPSEIVKKVREATSAAPKQTRKSGGAQTDDDLVWKETLLKQLAKISPAAFERLSQRLLRENGFTQVEVTGKTGDGGIDGKGIVRISGVLSFHVIFQCKRYKRAVPPKEIRDFRGAMQGRADKGLFITTSSFSRDAVKEATRDGAPPIDLVDGEMLCDKLKELRLGVVTTKVERVDIDTDWFSKL
jgi:restriction system protein